MQFIEFMSVVTTMVIFGWICVKVFTLLRIVYKISIVTYCDECKYCQQPYLHKDIKNNNAMYCTNFEHNVLEKGYCSFGRRNRRK